MWLIMKAEKSSKFSDVNQNRECMLFIIFKVKEPSRKHILTNYAMDKKEVLRRDLVTSILDKKVLFNCLKASYI